MKVMKFGGGCLRDEQSILQTAAVIAREDKPPAVVVSAVAGVTDLLVEAGRRAERSEDSVAPSLGKIRDIHLSLVEGLIRSRSVKNQTLRSMETALHRLEKLLRGIAYTAEVTAASRAALSSYGERLAAMLVAAVLAERGIPGRALDSDRLGMVTDDATENATVDLAAFKKNLPRALRRLTLPGTVPVITGFFGVTPRGRVATFGRNGSDYSAAVVALALASERLEIWKDVEGFMSADPKLVAGAKKIDRLSAYEAAELSYFGAKILHPRTLEPLRGVPIRVVIKSLWSPDSPGTEILPNGSIGQEVIKSVTSNPNIALLRIHGPGVGYQPGIIGAIGQKLAGLGINIFSIITSQTCINLLLDRKDAGRGYESLRAERGGVIERVDLVDDIALIAAVGEGLLQRKGLAARIFSSVSRAGVNVEMISTGASEVASYFIVDRTDLERTIRALHREFFPRSG